MIKTPIKIISYIESQGKSLVVTFLLFFFIVSFLHCSDNTPGYTFKAITPTKEINSLLKLAEDSISTNPHLSLNYSENAYKLALKYHLKNIIIDVMITKINALLNLSKFTEALNNSKEAMIQVNIHNSDFHKAKLLELSGIAYLNLDNLKQSSEYFYKSLNIFKKLNDNIGITNQNINIALLLIKQDQYDKALGFLHKAEIANKKKSIEASYKIKLALSKIYSLKKDYKNSIALNEQLIDESNKYLNYLILGDSYLNLGNTYLEINNVRLASNNINKAYTIFHKIPNPYFLAECNLLNSKLFLRTNDYFSSLKFAFKGKKIADSLNLKRLQFKALNLIEQVYNKKEDNKMALHYSKLMYSLKDSIALDNNYSQIDLLFFKEEFNKQKHQVLLKNQLLNFIFIIIIILLTILTILLFYFNIKQKKQESELSFEFGIKKEELKQKKSEKQILLNTIKENKKIYSSLSEEFKLMKATDDINQYDKKNLNKLIKELNKLIDQDINKELDVRLKQTPEDFNKCLTVAFPNLTPNELKLCSHIRSGKSNREISELTGQSLEAVDIGRYRLRKKLGINSKNINLADFLKSFGTDF